VILHAPDAHFHELLFLARQEKYFFGGASFAGKLKATLALSEFF